MTSLSFDDMLALIEDRSAALRAAAARADLGARVPGCPDWSVRDLVAHLGEVHRFWAAVVAAGPADGPPDDEDAGDFEPHGELLGWSADSTRALLYSLRAAGPDQGCWTWWETSGAPMTSGAVARHQVHEAAVHAFDAQQAAGEAQPLPPLAAADGVGEYLTVGLPASGPWPHDLARMLLDAGDGGTWLVQLGRDGAAVTEQARADRSVGADAGGGASTPGAPGAPHVLVAGDPSDILLAFYRRQGPSALQVAGDAQVLHRLLEWPNMD
jgi:uncharacterized protein (TIGR03083 family)